MLIKNAVISCNMISGRIVVRDETESLLTKTNIIPRRLQYFEAPSWPTTLPSFRLVLQKRKFEID